LLNLAGAPDLDPSPATVELLLGVFSHQPIRSQYSCAFSPPPIRPDRQETPVTDFELHGERDRLGRSHRRLADGYRIKRLAIDRERAPLVKKAFERYASGSETLDRLNS
jgi:hypothetical protein